MKKEKTNLNHWKKIFQFKNNTHKITKIIWITSFCISVILFLISSIFDREIASWFLHVRSLRDNHSNYLDVIMYFSFFFDWLGITCTIPLIFGLIAIILETVLYKVKQKHNWFLILIYAFYIIYPSIFIYTSLKTTFIAAHGKSVFGEGVNYWFGISKESMFTMRIIEAVIVVGIIIGLIIYMRTKFSKKTDLLVNDYWIDSLKIGVIFGIFGGVVLLIKYASGRAYQINVEYDYVVSKLPKSYLDIFLSSNNQELINSDYTEWWEFKLFNKGYLSDVSKGKLTFNDLAFPSGHMNAAIAMTLPSFFLFSNSKKNREYSWFTWTYFTVMLMNLICIFFGEILSGTHYVSDMAFTILMEICVIGIWSKAVDKIVYIIFAKYWKSKGIVFTTSVEEIDEKVFIYLERHSTTYLLKTLKKNDDTISKQKIEKWT